MPEIFRDLTKRDLEPGNGALRPEYYENNNNDMFNIFIYDVIQQKYRIILSLCIVI